MQAVLAKLRETGCRITVENAGIRMKAPEHLHAVRRVETAPFPGFPTDMQAQMTALLTRATGTSVIAENVFENRMHHLTELTRMGAPPVICMSMPDMQTVLLAYLTYCPHAPKGMDVD